METRFNPTLVVLSILVAILASYTALNLANTVAESKGRTRHIWLACGALAMGIGIWSMHFVGMLAFEMPGMEMGYDVPLMILSILVAVGASAMALFIVSRPAVPTVSIVSGGIAMAAAIAGMHYIGMYSMRMAAIIKWNLYLVVLSVVIALFASLAALLISVRLRHNLDRFGKLALASTVMGFAIAGMHYTGMLAATFLHTESPPLSDSNLLVSSGLATAVVSTTVLILGLAVGGSIGQRLWLLKKKLAEEGLVNSEERFRLLVDAVKDYAIFMLDPNGRITTWNSGAARITGYQESEISGQHFSIFYTQDSIDSGLPEEEIRTAKELGHFETEGLRIRRNGSMFWANSVLTPLFNREGQLSGFSKVIRDITKLRENEIRLRENEIRLQRLNEDLEKRVEERTNELQRAKEAAEVANTTKSAFLANMSHEIRTPLGAILGFSELIAGSEMSASERVNSVEVIKRNGCLLSNIINDILDLSKVEAGRLDVEKIEVPFTEIMTETGSLLNLEAAEKSVKLTITIEGTVPNAIKTDPLRLRQILLNIIGNAIKFTEKGSVDVTVKLLSPNASSPTKLAFVVRDTGAGISTEQAQRLFSPFTQADVSTTRKFGGTGLGLVLSKKLANALGGDVVLEESTLGKGSTFVVTIDPGKSNEVVFFQDGSMPSKVVHFPANPVDLRDFRILVADDSTDNQALIKHLLRLVGAKVETANDGKEAVAKALAGNFSLILMDLQMPEMDGYEATKTLRQSGFTKPIIALTAHAMKEERRRCLENGFNEHLTKPVDRDLLLRVLAEYPA